jgi:hypothetical protein
VLCVVLAADSMIMQMLTEKPEPFSLFEIDRKQQGFSSS